MKKNNLIKLIIFIIGIVIEVAIFIYGLIKQRPDEWHNTNFIFFTNIYIIYFRLTYFIDKYLKNK